VTTEAASLAGHLGLGKLIVLYDANHVCLAGGTGLSFSEDVAARFAAYRWHVQRVGDGNDGVALDRAIETAKGETARPSLIVVHTQIGFGAPTKQGSFAAHGYEADRRGESTSAWGRSRTSHTWRPRAP
jgi:transketolase